MQKPMKYFAYGSNLNHERMRDREINFTCRNHAVLKGFRIEFNKVASRNPEEGYANIVENKDGKVEGIIYEIQNSDLSKLDRREGYPNHYNRILVNVQLEDGQEVEAITYIAQPDKIRKGLKPSREYLAHMLKGSDLLSKEYCGILESIETLD